MSVKTKIVEMMDRVPENDLPILLEVVRHFVPDDYDDYASADDMAAHEKAVAEYKAGETVSHDEIDWG